MTGPRKSFERLCYKHRNKGIPNLMLYITLGTALVYFMNMLDENSTLFFILCFSREGILNGQVWRLFTYAITYDAGNIVYTAISLICYYSLGRAMENAWGTLKFNLFYLTGIVLMDIYCMIFGGFASVYYLNLSLFLGYATLYPNSEFLLFFIIPVKAWIFALIDLAIVLMDLLLLPLPSKFFPLIAIANYLLFFGAGVLNVFPLSWRANFRRLFRKKSTARQKPIPFPTAGSYQASVATPKAPYTHRCTVCGRTDISDPDLEFRYCSRCNGYHCYCADHISSHTHIQ